MQRTDMRVCEHGGGLRGVSELFELPGAEHVYEQRVYGAGGVRRDGEQLRDGGQLHELCGGGGKCSVRERTVRMRRNDSELRGISEMRGMSDRIFVCRRTMRGAAGLRRQRDVVRECGSMR